jgi:hypothetical protein
MFISLENLTLAAKEFAFFTRYLPDRTPIMSGETRVSVLADTKGGFDTWVRVL